MHCTTYLRTLSRVACACTSQVRTLSTTVSRRGLAYRRKQPPKPWYQDNRSAHGSRGSTSYSRSSSSSKGRGKGKGKGKAVHSRNVKGTAGHWGEYPSASGGPPSRLALGGATRGDGSPRGGRDKWQKEKDIRAMLDDFPGPELLYGASVVLAAMRTERRYLYQVFMLDPAEVSKDRTPLFHEIQSLAHKLGLAVHIMNRHDLTILSDHRPHGGVCLQCSVLPVEEVSSLPPITGGDRPCPLYLLLDELQDPQNVGAIIRSSYYFAVDGVVLSTKNCAPLSPHVSSAAAGALEAARVMTAGQPLQFLRESRAHGWKVWGTDAVTEGNGNKSQVVPLHGIPKERLREYPSIVVMGNEGKGMRELVRRECDEIVGIQAPQHMGQKLRLVDSLNVSVAAGIILDAFRLGVELNK